MALAGDTCQIGAGVFVERVTFPTSGTASNRIIFQGTMGGGGVLLTTVDGSSATSGWSHLGSGVYGASLGSPASLTATFAGAPRELWRIDDQCMEGTNSNCSVSGPTAMARSADARVNVAVTHAVSPCGPGNTCNINVWDGIEALWGNLAGQTRVRFRDSSTPAVMNVRMAASGGVLRILSKNYLTIRQLNIRGGELGVEVTGTSTGVVIEDNDIRHGKNQVAIFGGSPQGTIVQNNFLTPDSIGAVNWIPGDRNGRTYARALSRHMYDMDKFLVGTSEIRHAAVLIGGSGTGTQVLNNEIAYGVVGLYLTQTSTNTTFQGNTCHNFADICIYLNSDLSANFQVTDNLFYDSSHHMRLESTNRSHTIYIWANKFHEPWYNSGGGAGKHIFIPPHSGASSPMTAWIYHNSFGGGGWAVDFGGTSEGTFCYPNVQVLNNVFSAQPSGISSGGTGPLACPSFPGELAGNLFNSLWFNNTISNFVLPTNLRNNATSLIPRGIPGMNTAYYEDGAPDHGAVQGDETAPPVGPDPGPVLDILSTCVSADNSLNASVLGGLFYLPATVIFPHTTLVQAACASNVTMTDVASVVTSGYPTVRPFHFDAVGISPAGNTCTNCLSAHAGTPASNEAGAGWTLDDFHQGTGVSQATGGTSAFLLLPGLCKRYSEGVLTNNPLWPWSMRQRAIDAMVLAGKDPINIDATMSTLLGPIPTVCTTTDPLTPPVAQATWFIATDGVDGQACTIEAPCATLAHVGGRIAAVGPIAGGHTISVRAGTYDEMIDSGTNPIPGGTSWSDATRIAAYEQEEVIFAPTGTFLGVWFRNPTSDHYLILDRLIFDMGAPPATEVTGMAFQEGTHHIRVQNCTFRNSYYEHVIVNGGDHIQLLTNTFTDNSFVSAIRIMGNVDSLVVDGNTFANSAEYGLDTMETSLTNVQITRNTFHDMGQGGIGLGAGSTGTLVANNLIHSSLAGMKLRTGATATGVYNNTITENSGNGVQMDAGASGTLLTNNIVFGNALQIVDNGTGTVLLTNLETDPGFVGNGSYKIASASSPAVDEGTCLPGVVDVALDGVSRPQPVGGDCDIGAYERAGEGAPPIPPATGLSATPFSAHFMMVP